MLLLDLLLIKIFVLQKKKLSELSCNNLKDEVVKQLTKIYKRNNCHVTLYSLTSVCIFSVLFCIYFLRC